MAFLRKKLISPKQKMELHTGAENELTANMQTGKIDSRGLFLKKKKIHGLLLLSV